MKKLTLIIVIINMILLSSCSINEGNIREKINAPENNKPPILGKWKIKTYLNESDKDLLEEDLFLGKEALFHKDAIMIVEDYATDPTYKLKKVNAYDYLLYKYKVNPSTLDISQKEIEIISIFKDNQYFYEFIKVDKDKLILYLNGKFYLLEKIVDEISIEEINRYIEIEKTILRSFDTIEIDKVQTGVLLGIKIPTYDEINEVSNWEYKTIWINVEDGNILGKYELENLLVPRKNGFWMIDINRKVFKGSIRDEINAVPKFTTDKIKGKEILEEKDVAAISSLEERENNAKFPSILKNILFIGNDYISIEKIDIESNKKRILEIYALDNIEDEKPINLSDIIGPDGKSIFEEGAENILSLDDKAILDESNIGLGRKNGYWVFNGRVNYKQNNEELYKDFNIKAIPPEEMVSYDKISVPWNILKTKIPLAKDVYSSPNDDFIIVVTHSNLLLYHVLEGEILETEHILKIPFPSNASVIMSEWSIGRYPDIWQKEVIDNGGSLID